MVFLLCTAIYAFGRLTINICHWHFLLWRSFLRVRCGRHIYTFILYGIFHTLSVIKLYKLCNHFMYQFANFIANMGFLCRTLIYTPLAGLQSRFCHWRFLFRLCILKVAAISIRSFFVWHIMCCISYHITVLCTRLCLWPVYNQVFVTGVFFLGCTFLSLQPFPCVHFLYGILNVVSVII